MADNVTIVGGSYAATDYAADGTRNGAPEWKSGSNYLGVYLNFNDFRYHFFAGPFASDPDPGFDSFLQSSDPCDDEFNTLQYYVPTAAFADGAGWEVVDNGSPPTNLTSIKLTADDCIGYMGSGFEFTGFNRPVAWMGRVNSRASYCDVGYQPNGNPAIYVIYWNSSSARWEIRHWSTLGDHDGAGDVLYINTTDQDNLPLTGWTGQGELVGDDGGTYGAATYGTHTLTLRVNPYEFSEPERSGANGAAPDNVFGARAFLELNKAIRAVVDDGHDGSVKSCRMESDSGHLTKACALDGTFSFMFWLNHYQSGVFPFYVSFYDSADGSPNHVLGGNGSGYNTAFGSQLSTCPLPPWDNWVCWVVTVNGDAYTVYMNGIIVATGTADFTGVDTVILGGHGPGGTATTAAKGGEIAGYAEWDGEVLTVEHAGQLARGMYPGSVGTCTYFCNDFTGAGPHTPIIGTGNFTASGTVNEGHGTPIIGKSGSNVDTDDIGTPAQIWSRDFTDPAAPATDATFTRLIKNLLSSADDGGSSYAGYFSGKVNMPLDFPGGASGFRVKLLARRIDRATGNIRLGVAKGFPPANGQANIVTADVANTTIDEFAWEWITTATISPSTFRAEPGVPLWVGVNLHQISMLDVALVQLEIDYDGWESITYEDPGPPRVAEAAGAAGASGPRGAFAQPFI